MATSGKNHINILTYWKLELEWRQVSQSIANNTTTVEAKVYWSVTGGSNGGSATNTGSINIGGQSGNISYTSALSQNQRKLLGTVTKDITHDSNGKKSITISASIPINLTLNGTYVGTQTVSLTADLNDIPRASTITTFDNFSIGNNIPWAVDRKYSAYTHNLRLIVDGTTIVNENTTSASGTLSISSANKTTMLNKLSKTSKTISARLEVRTYTNSNYNVQVGSTVSKTVVGTARDDDIRPTVGTISHSEYVSMPTGITAYIQNKSRLNISVAGSSGLYGATISSTKITFAGHTINSASGTTSVINQAGTFKIIVEITDTRNVTQTFESADIEVLAYFNPIISDISIQRTNSSGVVDPLGIYLTVKAKVKVSSIILGGSQKNSIKYQADSGRVGQSFSSKVNTTDESLEKSFTHTFSGYVVDYAYNVRARGGDIFGWTGYIAGAIPTGIVLQHWGSDTTAFGMMIDSLDYNVIVANKGLKSHGYIVDKNDNEVIGLGGTKSGNKLINTDIKLGEGTLLSEAISEHIISDSNANGRYTKFPDGTMICTMIKDFNLGQATWQTGNFPQEFIEKPACSFSIDKDPVSGDSYAFLGKIGQVQVFTHSTTQFAILTRNTPTGTEVGRAFVTAIGRWK